MPAWTPESLLSRTKCLLEVLVLLNVFTWPARAQTTGLIPINDLGPGLYAGFSGGLYPGGSNSPPAGHLTNALAAAALIVPRNAAGAPDPDGWIGMIAVGMSNTTHEFGAFERNADADPTRNARVILVDTGLGGQTATIIANPTAAYWSTMTSRLVATGLTAAQVQVAWLKEAEAVPPNNFPLHAQALRDTLKKVVRNLHLKFPNLRICYVSSRIYGGYSAPGSLNPEPQAYESGFSAKWLIEDQINGDPNLNYGQLPGTVWAPILLWGPYLWADGVNPRSDGLTWDLVDLESDHVHPSSFGEQKVADLLGAFFAAEPTATAWWPAMPGETLVTFDALDDSHVSATVPGSNFGADPLLLVQGGATPINTYARFDLSTETRPVRFAKLSLRVSQSGGSVIRPVVDTTWNEGTITYTSAPAMGAALLMTPQSSRDGTIGANVTSTVLADPDRVISFGLTNASSNQSNYISKEGGQPPRLVLVVTTSTSGVTDLPLPAPRLGVITPNPASGNSRILFELPRPARIELTIHSVDGRLVRRLLAAELAAGQHDLSWDGRDDAGRSVPPGVYVARLAGDGVIESSKLTRLR